MFSKWFTPPVFEGDEERTRVAGLLNSILLFVIMVTAAALPFLLLFTEPADVPALLILLLPYILVNIVAWALMRRGSVAFASYLFLFNIGLAIFGSYAVSSATSNGSLLAITIVIAFTNVLLGARAVGRLIAFVILFTFAVTVAQAQGWITPLFAPATGVYGNWVASAIVFALTGVGVYLSSVSLRKALDRSLADRHSLQTTNQEMTSLQKVLEARVQERTADLEKRAAQLETVSNVASAIASVQALDKLLPAITNLVSEKFGFYHTGIFLVDEENQFAILRAANSEGGRRMLARQHKLPRDTKSMVGYTVTLAQPRIALDVELDTVHFRNPDLPETRSELTLPLRVAERTIGALDVQSTQTNAFAQEDVEVLTILADQIAIAIENAQLFSNARHALNESQATMDHYVKQEWKSFSRQMRQNSFTFDGRQVAPVAAPGQAERARHTAQTGRLSLEKYSANLTVPIKLRGQTIGTLEVRPRQGQRNWTEDEIILLEAAADRAAFALENARLVESAQRRASRERAIGEISSKIGIIVEQDQILQTAVEELGRKIGNSEIVIELDRESP
ncbi:MAG: GAF domain-containing protein [Anaerolineales bacterium]|nr:GAF domain-containing protein [Anaerolineales bacterium]